MIRLAILSDIHGSLMNRLGDAAQHRLHLTACGVGT